MNNELIPANEAARLQALARYRNLGTIQEQVFDELVRLTACLCQVPIAFLSLVEAETVWFRNTVGWTGAEHLARDYSLCSVAILQEEALVFENLHQEPCKLIHSAEIDLLNLQFFSGLPLRTYDGLNIGVLAIADHEPRAACLESHLLLQAYASFIVGLLELYRAAAHSRPIPNGVYEAVEDTIRWMQKLSATLTSNGAPTRAELSRIKEAIGREAHDTTLLLQRTLAQWLPPHASGAA